MLTMGTQKRQPIVLLSDVKSGLLPGEELYFGKLCNCESCEKGEPILNLTGGTRAGAKRPKEITKNVTKDRPTELLSDPRSGLLPGEEFYYGKLCNCKQCEDEEQKNLSGTANKKKSEVSNSAFDDLLKYPDNVLFKKSNQSNKRATTSNEKIEDFDSEEDEYGDWEGRQEFISILQKHLEKDLETSKEGSSNADKKMHKCEDVRRKRSKQRGKPTDKSKEGKEIEVLVEKKISTVCNLKAANGIDKLSIDNKNSKSQENGDLHGQELLFVMNMSDGEELISQKLKQDNRSKSCRKDNKNGESYACRLENSPSNNFEVMDDINRKEKRASNIAVEGKSEFNGAEIHKCEDRLRKRSKQRETLTQKTEEKKENLAPIEKKKSTERNLKATNTIDKLSIGNKSSKSKENGDLHGQEHLSFEMKIMLGGEEEIFQKPRLDNARNNSCSKNNENGANYASRLRNLPRENYAVMENLNRKKGTRTSKMVTEEKPIEEKRLEEEKHINPINEFDSGVKKRPRPPETDHIFISPKRICRPKKRQTAKPTKSITTQNISISSRESEESKRRTLYSPASFSLSKEAATLFGVEDGF